MNDAESQEMGRTVDAAGSRVLEVIVLKIADINPQTEFNPGQAPQGVKERSGCRSPHLKVRGAYWRLSRQKLILFSSEAPASTAIWAARSLDRTSRYAYRTRQLWEPFAPSSADVMSFKGLRGSYQCVECGTIHRWALKIICETSTSAPREVAPVV